ncbi:hypothetical protein C8Q77DRAFT_192413 [Trametes polyzona]|nr:hypothetical protein C8Q77DRAFT_192413 [Trametes polyzona]
MARVRVCSVLRHLPVFSALSPPALPSIAANASALNIKPGTPHSRAQPLGVYSVHVHPRRTMRSVANRPSGIRIRSTRTPPVRVCTPSSAFLFGPQRERLNRSNAPVFAVVPPLRRGLLILSPRTSPLFRVLGINFHLAVSHPPLVRLSIRPFAHLHSHCPCLSHAVAPSSPSNTVQCSTHNRHRDRGCLRRTSYIRFLGL